MDATKILIADHDKIKTLFKRFFASQSRHRRAAFLYKIRSDLLDHMRAEEEVFYPFCNRYPECRMLVQRAIDSLQRIHLLLAQVSAMREDAGGFAGRFAGRFDDQMAALMEAVEDHIDDDEADLFPVVRESAGPVGLASVGDRLQATLQASKRGGVDRGEAA